jgi:hypothetical protein
VFKTTLDLNEGVYMEFREMYEELGNVISL